MLSTKTGQPEAALKKPLMVLEGPFKSSCIWLLSSAGPESKGSRGQSPPPPPKYTKEEEVGEWRAEGGAQGIRLGGFACECQAGTEILVIQGPQVKKPSVVGKPPWTCLLSSTQRGMCRAEGSHHYILRLGQAGDTALWENFLALGMRLMEPCRGIWVLPEAAPPWLSP